MTRFDTDTAVERTSDGLFVGRIDPGWWIVNGPNGGYVAAILLRALTAEVDDASRAPRSLTIHYLRPPAAGKVEIATTTERRGRTLTTVTARLLQGERLLALAVGAFASAREGFTFDDRVMPSMPLPEGCERTREKFPGLVELQNRFDSRWGLGGLGGGASHAVVGGWIRFEEPRVPDALAVSVFTDSFPPAIFARATSRTGIGPVPTIDLTIHFRATLPLPSATPEDYCAVVFTSNTSREGFVEEDSEVWSPNGVLLAQSRQLALVG